MFALTDRLGGWGVDPTVVALTQPYLNVLTWSVVPLLLYATFRRYLQGMGVVRPIIGRAHRIQHRQSRPELDPGCTATSARLRWACGALHGPRWYHVWRWRWYLLEVILMRERGRRPGLFETSLRIEMASFRRLIALGFPAAAQLSLEVGVFAAASVLTGRLAPVALASHQIALNIASVTFMVPLGVSSAGAVRVGHAVGRRDTAGAERAGWTALLIGSAFMSVAAAAFVLAPRALVGAFSVDEGVLCVGTALLFVAAVFQLFDGLQCVATGVLRGLGDTRTPMLWNLLGHWLIGLPFGYVLCFVLDCGVVGLWWGLSTGPIGIRGIALLTVWTKRIAALKRDSARLGPTAGSTYPAVRPPVSM